MIKIVNFVQVVVHCMKEIKLNKRNPRLLSTIILFTDIRLFSCFSKSNNKYIFIIYKVNAGWCYLAQQNLYFKIHFIQLF